MKTRPKGHTLIELLISCAVMMIFMSLVYQMFVAAKRYQENCQAKMELQENVLKSLGRMGQELVESDRYGVQVDATNNTFSFATPRGLDGIVSFDSLGRMFWKKYVCYYVAQSPTGVYTLYRKVRALNPYVTDVPAAPAPTTIRDDNTLNERLVAPNIRKLNPISNPDGTYEIIITGELKIYSRTYGVEVNGKVFPNN